MTSFKNKDGAIIIEQLIQTIQENRDYLSEIDGKIGDGDHGINMNKGFTMCQKKLEGKDFDMSEGFCVLGETLLDDIGGSMGPLYGLLFDELGETSSDHDQIDSEVFQEMLSNVVDAIGDISPAKVGDKTLMDTLIPATKAFVEAKNKGDDFTSCLEQMQKAAEEGWKSTENLVAKIGRASRLGELSKGNLDAGATSCYLILNSIGTTAKQLLN